MTVPITWAGLDGTVLTVAPRSLVPGRILASVGFCRDTAHCNSGKEPAGFYGSDDYGLSWSYLGPSTAISEPLTIAYDQGNADLVYAGTQGKGLWRSADAGESWQAVPDVDVIFPGHGGPALSFLPIHFVMLLLAVLPGQYPVSAGSRGLHSMRWTGISAFVIQPDTINHPGLYGIDHLVQLWYTMAGPGQSCSPGRERTWRKAKGDRSRSDSISQLWTATISPSTDSTPGFFRFRATRRAPLVC